MSSMLRLCFQAFCCSHDEVDPLTGPCFRSVGAAGVLASALRKFQFSCSEARLLTILFPVGLGGMGLFSLT